MSEPAHLAALEPWLQSLGIDSLAHPERLPWLALAVALGILLAYRRPASALPWPALVEASVAGARRFEIVPLLALVLRGACLACLAVVLADPIAVHRAPPESGQGLDLILVLDTSGSMRALDTEVEGRSRTRLELAKQVVARFATKRVAAGDRVGLVVFGKTAFTQCPLTADGGLLTAALARVTVGMAGEATALGDALALAVKRAGGGGGGAGQVVVLLTDGRSNAGGIPLEIATQLAAGGNIRVHSVGIGTGGELVPMAAARSQPKAGLRFERHDPDLPALREVARATGGRFFSASRSRDLPQVYAEIDALERVARPMPPRIRENAKAEPLLAAAGALLCLEIAIARVWRRRLP